MFFAKGRVARPLLLLLGLVLAGCPAAGPGPSPLVAHREAAKDYRPAFQRLYAPRYPSAETPRLTPLGDFDTPRDYQGQSWRHRGIDIVGEAGDPVIAAAPGLACWERDEIHGLSVLLSPERALESGERRPLVFVTERKGGGRTAEARRHRVEIRYSHLRQVAPAIEPCARVALGQVIGAMGDSGMASVPHLHFEILAREPAFLEGDPTFAGAINPFYVMRREGGQPLGTITCYAPAMDYRANEGQPEDALTIVWPTLAC